MKEIYKVYFDGKKIASEVQYFAFNNGIPLIYHSEELSDIARSISLDSIDKVSAYSLGESIGYTFKKENIEILKDGVRDSIIRYHSSSIGIKRRDIREHRRVLTLLDVRELDFP